MVRSLCGTNPNSLHYNSIMETEIPQEVKEMLEGHIMQICELHKRMADEDFINILNELCKGSFIAGQKAAVEQLKEEIIFKPRGWTK